MPARGMKIRVSALLVTLLAFGGWPPLDAAAAEDLAEDIRTLTLEAAGRPDVQLTRDDTLAAIARAHSAEMFRRDELAHELDGIGPAERVARGHRMLFGLVAENVAMRSGPLDASTLAGDFVHDWMNSPPHRENILRDYDVLEVGCFRDARTAYCTQLFVQEAGRLAEPVPYGLDASDELVLRLATPEAGVEQRIGLRGADAEDADSGSPVVAGTARLRLTEHRGTNQLTLWTQVDGARYRIVPGPFVCIEDRSSDLLEEACPSP